MIRLVIALYAFGLLLYPAWGLVSPEPYRAELAEDFAQALTATAAQLQTAAGIHWLKNAYLAFVFLLLARFIGRPEQPGDVKRAGVLLFAFPIVLLAYESLAQIALSADTDELDLKIRLSSEMLLYGILGLSLMGIARTLVANAPTTTSGEEPAP